MAPKKKASSRAPPLADQPTDRPPKSAAQSTSTVPNPSNADKPIPCLRSGAAHGPPALIFTHGAGGTLSAPAVVHFTAGFAASLPMLAFQGSMNLGARVKGFEAVLAHESEASGATAAADDGSQRIACFGGRSMGARAAVIAATGNPAAGITSLILVSYPLQSEKGDLRDQILLDLPAEANVLFISGDRDGMCDLRKLDLVRKKMKARSWMIVVKGADHGMGVSGGKAATEALGVETGKVAAQWVKRYELWHGETEGEIWWDRDAGEVRRSDPGEGAVVTEEKNEAAKEDETEKVSVPSKRRRKSVTTKEAQRPPTTTPTNKKRQSLAASKDPKPTKDTPTPTPTPATSTSTSTSKKRKNLPASEGSGLAEDTPTPTPATAMQSDPPKKKRKGKGSQGVAGSGLQAKKKDAGHRSAAPAKKGKGRLSQGTTVAAPDARAESAVVTRSSKRAGTAI